MELKLRPQPIDYKDSNHSYTNSENGDYLTGVSAVLNVKAKDFMAPWFIKEMYSYLKSNWDLKKVYNSTEKEELLQLGKTAANRVSGEAREFGTDVHEWIEKYIKNENPKPLENTERQVCVQKFIDWTKQHKIEWLASEVVVANLELQIAGTLDAVALVDGKLSLLDFKCSKNISETYFLQLAAYQFMLNPLIEGDRKIEQRVVVHIPKDERPVNGFVVDSKYDFDLEVFLHLREVKRWDYYIKNHHAQGYLGIGHYYK